MNSIPIPVKILVGALVLVMSSTWAAAWYFSDWQLEIDALKRTDAVLLCEVGELKELVKGNTVQNNCWKAAIDPDYIHSRAFRER